MAPHNFLIALEYKADSGDATFNSACDLITKFGKTEIFSNSVFILQTDADIKQVFDVLRQSLPPIDKIVVGHFSGSMQQVWANVQEIFPDAEL